MNKKISDIKTKLELFENIYYKGETDKEKYIQIISELTEIYSWICSQINDLKDFEELKIAIENNTVKIVEECEYKDLFGLLDIMENETKQILDIIEELIEE